MLKTLAARIRQGHRTMRYPAGPAPELPDRFRGRPLVEAPLCPRPNACRRCVQACPTGAIELKDREPGRGGASGGSAYLSFDLGACLFCGDCAAACPAGAIRYSRDHRLAVRKREHLLCRGEAEEGYKLAEALQGKLLRLFGRSLRLREVSAGGCGACEADSNVLTTIGWDMERFGIQFVASPRHADGLWVTGPVSANMKLALEKTYAAIPAPRLVLAVGSCAVSGGPFRGFQEVCGGVHGILPVDLYVPGCPPHPLTILDGLLRLLKRLP